jgi:hypothetical protein
MLVPFGAPKTNDCDTSGAQSQFCAIDDSESNGKSDFVMAPFQHEETTDDDGLN